MSCFEGHAPSTSTQRWKLSTLRDQKSICGAFFSRGWQRIFGKSSSSTGQSRASERLSLPWSVPSHQFVYSESRSPSESTLSTLTCLALTHELSRPRLPGLITLSSGRWTSGLDEHVGETTGVEAELQLDGNSLDGAREGPRRAVTAKRANDRLHLGERLTKLESEHLPRRLRQLDRARPSSSACFVRPFFLVLIYSNARGRAALTVIQHGSFVRPADESSHNRIRGAPRKARQV